MLRKPSRFQLRNYYICLANKEVMIAKELIQCIDDMRQVAQCGKMSLDAQIRAYDLLEKILDFPVEGSVGEFCSEYMRLSDDLAAAYDEAALENEAKLRLEPYEKALSAAAALSAQRVELHQCAKGTFEIWQNKGFIARQSALRKLRSLAGFRLESNRIGNFVAKTFDLMNEAQAAQARAQQALFSANVSYKIKPAVYRKIAENLQAL